MQNIITLTKEEDIRKALEMKVYHDEEKTSWTPAIILPYGTTADRLERLTYTIAKSGKICNVNYVLKKVETQKDNKGREKLYATDLFYLVSPKGAKKRKALGYELSEIKALIKRIEK